MSPRGRAVFISSALAVWSIGVIACSREESGPREQQKRPELVNSKSSYLKVANVSNIGTDDFSDSNFYFANISAVRLDNENNIYVLDSRDFVLRVFTLMGVPVRTIVLKQGQGPGEFLRPKCLAVDAAHLYIGDANKMRIIILEMSGNYVTSIPVKFQPAEIEVCSGELFVTGFFDYSENRVHVYDKETGREARTFAPATRWTKEVAEFGEKDSIFALNGNIYYSSFFPYEIRVYSVAGKRIGSFSRRDSRFSQQLERDKVTGALDFVIGTEKVLADTDGRVFNIVKTRDISKRTFSCFIDVFDPKGRWVVTLEPSEFGEANIRIADMNRQGYLVIDSTCPFPRVRAFSLKTAY